MNSSAMLNQESSLTLRNKFGQSDGIRSTKAFLTSVTPNAGMEKKQSLAFGSDIQQDLAMGKKGPREVFGAKAYLERQKQQK